MRLHGKLLRTSASASAILLGLFVAASASAADAGRANVRIDNFGRVNASYYRGGQPQGQDYADLAALGVKTIINLTSDDAEASEPSMVERAGMTYYQIPMTTHRAPTTAEVSQFLSLVNDPKNQPVYVHCVGGKHRTGVMTAVYRMTEEGWSADRAFSEMKNYGFGMDFLHPEFKSYVYAYPAQMARVAAANGVTAGAATSAVATKAEVKQQQQR